MPDISEIVDVTITVQSSGLARKGFNSLLIVGDQDDVDVGFSEYEVRKYTTFNQVDGDTDILSGRLKDALTVAFGQNPSVPDVYVSYIDTSAVAEVHTISWDADFVTANSIAVDIDGSPIAASPIAFNTDQPTTLEDVRAAIDAEGDYTATTVGPRAIRVDKVTPDVAFTLASVVTGGASQPVASDVVDTPAQAAGIITSDDLSAIAANNNEWFGYAHVFTGDNNITAAGFCAANKKYGWFRQTDFDDPGLNTNFASSWYTDSTENTGASVYLEVAIASRSLALIPGSYTTAFKTLEVVGTSVISATDEATLRSFNVNQYSEVAGRPITWDGKAGNGGFIDTYIGVLYLEARIQEDVFGQLAAVNKVPYTNAGVNLVVSAVQNRLQQSVLEGFLTDDPAPVTTAPLVTDISAVDKSNRLLPNVNFEAVTAGAIHTVQINGVIVA